METKEFDYRLPEDLIAQTPAHPRDAAKMMVLHRKDKQIEHRLFRDLPEYLHEGDCLVTNKTRVIKARIHTRRKSGGNVELLLLRKRAGLWEALGRPYHRIKPAEIFELATGQIHIISKLGDGRMLVRLAVENENIFLENYGELPLPPYINTAPVDESEYQTVYAETPGSVAAPTAGLHFTPELLAKIDSKGVQRASCVLNIGMDTFRPIRTPEIEQHEIHSEHYSLEEEETTKINTAKKKGGRIIAVGTTATRVLESCGIESTVVASQGETSLYIIPGYQFNVVDVLITNFHLPMTSLLVMVSAFAGKDFLLEAYREAVEKQYRFFSFGDAMLIV